MKAEGLSDAAMQAFAYSYRELVDDFLLKRHVSLFISVF
jgi:hypothetical protein